MTSDQGRGPFILNNPQLVRSLLEHEMRNPANPVRSTERRDRELLIAKARFLARYASATVLKEIQQLYYARGPRFEDAVRQNLKKFLDRRR